MRGADARALAKLLAVGLGLWLLAVVGGVAAIALLAYAAAHFG